jgi:hypothetical protein
MKYTVFRTSNEVASSMRVIRKTKNFNGLYACQTGIMTDISLQGIWEDLNDSRLGVSFIITRRINQNSTENLFSVIRSVGGTPNILTQWKLSSV